MQQDVYASVDRTQLQEIQEESFQENNLLLILNFSQKTMAHPIIMELQRTLSTKVWILLQRFLSPISD